MNNQTLDFANDVIARSKAVPVVVDFWAPWCGPCRYLKPVLEKLAGEASGRWELVKVNVDEHPGLAEIYGIRGIPDVRLFRDGGPVTGFTGAQPEGAIRLWLDHHLSARVSTESA